MSERSAIEIELMDASKFKSKNYPDRQDELAALVRAVERIPEKAFDLLSDEAAEWYNNAAKAMNEHDDIPDFEEPEDEDEDEDTSDDHEHEADEAAEDDDADDDADEVNEGSVEEDEADEEPAPAKGKAKAGKPASKQTAKAKREVEADEDTGSEQLDAEEAPKKGRSKAKAKAEVAEPADTDAEDSADNDEQVPQGPKPKAPKPLKNKRGQVRTPYDNLTGEKDRFGLFIGTKTQQAVELYSRPEGATCKQVEMELAGRHRNILKRLEKEGHRVEKFEGGVIKVTHKDDLNAKVKKGKK
jgi:hypothetical protein